MPETLAFELAYTYKNYYVLPLTSIQYKITKLRRHLSKYILCGCTDDYTQYIYYSSNQAQVR